LNNGPVSSNIENEEKEERDSPNKNTAEAKSYVVDAPKLVGEAMEEFVSLALTNAKNQINHLEQVNSDYERESYALRNEIQLLKLRLAHGDLQCTVPIVPIKQKAAVNDADSDTSSVRSSLNAKAVSHFTKLKQRTSKLPILSSLK
jgi:hypothetical protein